MNIPSQEDWGDLSDLDTAHAYKFFFGKTHEDTLVCLKKNLIIRCLDFYYMPIKVFTYYSYALLLYIEKSNISDFKAEKYADEVDTAADCLFNEFSERASSNPIEIRNIFPDFYPLMSKIAKNQNAYGLDEDIYGDFQEKLEYIESKLNEINN